MTLEGGGGGVMGLEKPSHQFWLTQLLASISVCLS